MGRETRAVVGGDDAPRPGSLSGGKRTVGDSNEALDTHGRLDRLDQQGGGLLFSARPARGPPSAAARQPRAQALDTRRDRVEGVDDRAKGARLPVGVTRQTNELRAQVGRLAHAHPRAHTAAPGCGAGDLDTFRVGHGAAPAGRQVDHQAIHGPVGHPHHHVAHLDHRPSFSRDARRAREPRPRAQRHEGAPQRAGSGRQRAALGAGQLRDIQADDVAGVEK